MSVHFPELAASFDAALRELIGKPVAVLGHVRPDGDCIGSQVALARVLRSLGADAVCVNQHPVPRNCAAFVGDTPFFLADAAPLEGRIAVSVDCADRKRLGAALDKRFPEIFLNVDHHISNTRYACHNFVAPASAATGEVLGGLFIDNGYAIDAVTAQALYVGVATDTGQFRFGSTTKQTFDICRDLMDCGADPAAAALELYENESPSKLALLQRFLASLSFHCDGRACIGVLRPEDFAETGAIKEDTEGLVDYARAIAGVEIGVLLEHVDGITKGSFRAKHPVHRVDELARGFNGGGHACAAGFNPGISLEELYPRVVNALESHFKNLKTGV